MYLNWLKYVTKKRFKFLILQFLLYFTIYSYYFLFWVKTKLSFLLIICISLTSSMLYSNQYLPPLVRYCTIVWRLRRTQTCTDPGLSTQRRWEPSLCPAPSAQTLSGRHGILGWCHRTLRDPPGCGIWPDPGAPRLCEWCHSSGFHQDHTRQRTWHLHTHSYIGWFLETVVQQVWDT